MDAIRQQYTQLKQAWTTAYSVLAPNPSAYQPHLAGASLEQINEAVKALGIWIDRVRAPKGFAPTFHLSRSLAATALSAATTAGQALARGELGHFPQFITAVNQCISALHTTMVFSETSPSREVIADLAGKLAEAVALLDTAQTELATKSEKLESATSQLSDLEELAGEVRTWASQSEQDAAQARKYGNDAVTVVAAATEAAGDLRKLKHEADALLEKASVASETIEARTGELEAVINRAVEQEELIAALLPKGASAGLASAFAGRVQQLERTKWLWMGVFAIAMASLFLLTWGIVSLQPQGVEALWQVLLQRLPLAAPMIWLGWFAAIQYGNTLRVQEDYAFKEATSKAFAGYRDHMEHLANVSLEEGNTAMTLMAQRTIEILAHEPLRIFGGIDIDAAPTPGILDRFRRQGKRDPSPKQQ